MVYPNIQVENTIHVSLKIPQERKRNDVSENKLRRNLPAIVVVGRGNRLMIKVLNYFINLCETLPQPYIKIMKTILIVFFFASILLTGNSGCSKSDTTTTTLGGGGSGPIITDPATLLLGRWQVVKDSIVVNNFAFSNGYIPIPGIYYGTANDYWLFQTNGTVYIYEGGYVGTPAYQLLSSTSLLIPAFDWGDVTILALTSTNFIWEKAITGSNGGTYYRKAYFRK